MSDKGKRTVVEAAAAMSPPLSAEALNEMVLEAQAARLNAAKKALRELGVAPLGAIVLEVNRALHLPRLVLMETLDPVVRQECEAFLRAPVEVRRAGPPSAEAEPEEKVPEA